MKPWRGGRGGRRGLLFFTWGKKGGEKEPCDSISEIHPFFQVSNFTGNSQEINFSKILLQALFQVDKTNISNKLRVRTGGKKKKGLIYTRNPTRFTTEAPLNTFCWGVGEQAHLPAVRRQPSL